ncbi:Vacuolar protein sorting-associated protein 45 [Portunus trituberculatus]|uniref:Vacuolar protein sorting-associated protein 45 n=1 Tax=Portunus trituberculatus TaxID=210409 RepID=A0A5B7DAD3_PORTR|nr:Vacuolar protein sorting-associated protein 45 [Portunus trituberculatus]
MKGLKWASGALQRTVQGVAAVLFSLQVLPSIRYQNNSEMARVLAENIRQTILNESSLYNSPDAEGNTLLLILDRRDDPVTPLLHQASHTFLSMPDTLKTCSTYTLHTVCPCFTHYSKTKLY